MVMQWDGEFWSGQSYLRERLSLKVALWKTELCSSMGNAVNQRLPFPERVPWNIGEGLVDYVGVLLHPPSALCV